MRTRDPQFRTRCLIYAGLAVITLALYLPALYHNFVEYDDQQYVTDNPRVQAGLTWHGLVWAFGYHAGNWHPLAWLSHMLDCQLYGARAGGHHLTSVLLHTGTTLLLFALLNRMTQAMWRSAAVAALFAWHPLHVESVAWVAERKDVLCAFFWMLTLLAYAKYAGTACRTSSKPLTPALSPLGRGEGGEGDVRRGMGSEPLSPGALPRRRYGYYWLTILCFVLALMAKPMAVTLPFVLLLLDFWPLRRLPVDSWQGKRVWRLIWEKMPFFLLVIGGCVLTLQAQQMAIVSTAGLSVSQRLIHVLVAYNHYVVALFVPYPLAVYYPYEFHVPALTVAVAAVVLGLITAFAFAGFRQRPYLITGWLWYLGTLVPVIGLVQVGDQNWADRYTYLPSVGLLMPVVWLAAELIQKRVVLQGMFAMVAVAASVATAVQLGYWADTRTLFEHTAKVTEKNALAYSILGSLYTKEGKPEKAMEYYQTALKFAPTFPEAHFFLANALDEQGKLDEAVAEYQQVLWFKPMQEQTHIFMAIALAKQKKYDEAIGHYSEAIKLNPDSAAAHNNLARLFHTMGRFDAAIDHYTAALEIDPKLSIAHNNLGVLLLQKGDLLEGTRQLREALKQRPNNAETQFNLATALNQQGQWDEAAELFRKVMSKYSADSKAHFEFARALAQLKKTREAMSEYAAALLIQPDYPDALDGLAWILATASQPEFRNGAQAVQMAERACALTENKDPVKLKTLAAAYAEAGRYTEAVKTIDVAIVLANDGRQAALANECVAMLGRFQKSEAWRE